MESAPSSVSAGLASLLKVSEDLKLHPWKTDVVADTMPDVVTQLERLARVPLFIWRPFGEWPPDPTLQVSYLADDSRIKMAVCGNRSGKTVMANVEDAFDSLLLDPLLHGPSHRYADPISAWVVSDTEETSINIIQRGISDLLGEESGFGWELVDDSTKYDISGGFKNNEMVWTTGSRLGFKFSTQKRRSFQGVSLDKVRLDEEPPKEIYSECYARVIDKNGRIAITFTPVYDRLRGLSWIHDELYVPAKEKGVTVHNWSIYDNPHLSEPAKIELAAQWEEDERDVRAYGVFTPMGIKPAIDRQLLRQYEQGAEKPRSIYMQIGHSGMIEMVDL